jgi:drug/metabolite transporter (DMT)-like permease
VTARAHPARDWIWLGLLWLVWGTSWPAMRAVFLEMPVWQFRAITCLIGGAALLLIAHLAGGTLRVPPRQWVALAAASLFNIIVWHVATGYGLLRVGAGHAAVICYTMPVWTALLSTVFLHERLSARILIALVLGMGGVAVLLSYDFAGLIDRPAGYLFVLAAAFGWAFGTIVVKRVRWQVGMTALAGWQLLLASVPIGIIAIATERFALHEASLRAYIGATHVLFLGVIAGYALWFRVVDRFPASVGSIGTLVIPVVGVATGALFLGEAVGWREITALALVLSAVALALFAPRPVAALAGEEVFAIAHPSLPRQAGEVGAPER